MREILFRGKNTHGGCWAYGNYTHPANSKKHYIICETDQLDKFSRYWHVDSETVGQYTGLKDKNGKKIFEGDIAKDSRGKIHEVVFEQRNGSAYFGITVSDIETWPFSHMTSSNDIEVIGNIHDNPKLLEE